MGILGVQVMRYFLCIRVALEDGMHGIRLLRFEIYIIVAYDLGTI